MEETLIHPGSGNPLQISSSWERRVGSFRLCWHYDHLLPDGKTERVTLEITDGTRNGKIPKDRDPKSLTLEECQAILAAAPERKGRWGRKAPAKKTAAAETPAAKAAPKKKAVAKKKATTKAAKKKP